ncbi:hypothetical protein ANO14919_137470 [Xylariales sp. No.14919]|nr:hypothetical protein ANO14919_137470 [Xylariales sp. No.14919]
MADALPPPVNPSDPGIGPLIMGLTWTFTSLSLIVIGLRFWIRLSLAEMLSLEDWLMLAAGLINLICQAFNTVSFHYGMGKHDRDLTFDQVVNTLKWEWLASTPGIVSSAISRISIAILFVRIFGTKYWLKWYIIIAVVLQTLGASLLIILTVRASEDLTYVLFPILIIWRLNMQLHRKALLSALLALSSITLGVSIIKTIHAQGRLGDKGEALFNASVGSLLGSLEQEFVIIMGCAPSLSSVTKLKIKSLSDMALSLGNLRSSAGGANKSNMSTRLCEYDSNGTYLELGVAGQTLSKAHAGLETNSSDVPSSGKIYKTPQYNVTSG